MQRLLALLLLGRLFWDVTRFIEANARDRVVVKDFKAIVIGFCVVASAKIVVIDGVVRQLPFVGVKWLKFKIY